MQLFITIIIILAALAYTFYRLYRRISGKETECDGCEGCKLKNSCDKEKIERKRNELIKKGTKNLAKPK